MLSHQRTEMSLTWSNLLSSKLGLCMNGKFNHMSARYDFVFVYNIIYLSFKEGVGVGSGDTTVDEVLACHQCGLGSSTGVKTQLVRGLSLLLVFSLFPRGFSPGLQFSPLLKKL